MTRPPLKVIEWEDAFNGEHSWVKAGPESIPKKIKPLVLTTVGFEIRRCKKRVTLAMSYGDSHGDPQCCDLFTIPVAMIRRERTIK